MSLPITYLPDFIPDADAVFRRLWAELAWERRGTTPRREYYANDFPMPYAYSVGPGEREYLPKPWHPDMLAIRQRLEAHTGTKFEVCFLNGYEDQRDHLGWHADASPEMDPKRPIGIVSLGVAREIWFMERPRSTRCLACNGSGRYDAAGSPPCSACNGTGKEPKPEVHKLKLESGSLCLMAAGMQQTHLHRIPKAGFVCGERVSLTFRGYLPGAR